MKIHHGIIQGSSEWLSLRASFPTASEFSSLVTPAALKPSASIKKYVALKLAEKWLGGPLQSFGGSGDTDQGKVREEEARPWYSLEYSVDVETPGFITNDAGTAGCSPDGIIPSLKRGLEIKCGQTDTHVGWLLAGTLPTDHLLQVQGSLWVTGFDEWVFLSYHARFPAFVKTVKRDRAVCAAIEEAIGIYWDLFEQGWEKLIDANGGEGPKPPEFDTYTDDEGATVRRLKPEYDVNSEYQTAIQETLGVGK